MIIWTLHGSSGKETSKALKHFSFMNEAKVEEIEDKLSQAIHVITLMLESSMRLSSEVVMYTIENY